MGSKEVYRPLRSLSYKTNKQRRYWKSCQLLLSMRSYLHLAHLKEHNKSKHTGHLRKQPQRPRCRENNRGRKPVINKARLFLNNFYCFSSKTRCFIQCFESHCSPIWQAGRRAQESQDYALKFCNV